MSEIVPVFKASRGDAANVEDMAPSTLTRYDNGQWLFIGDDVTPPSKVMGRIIEVESEKSWLLRQFAGHSEAATFAAAAMLYKHNAHLKGQHPDAAFPRGQQFVAYGGQSLKALLAPWARKLPELEAHIKRFRPQLQSPGVLDFGPGNARGDVARYSGQVWNVGRPIE